MNSIWTDSVPNILSSHNKINKNISCDVAIIGGGLTGLTSAYYLGKHGIKSIILEKDFLMSKTSGNTTGKITAQHDLFYKYLIDTFDIITAKKYLDSNLNAIKEISNIIEKENINCDFEYQSSFIFTRSNKYVQQITDEQTALNELNFQTTLHSRVPLPTNDILCSLEFPNQAQFNPRKYATGLCKSILSDNGLIFENSKVTNVEKCNDGYLLTVNDYLVKAKKVILATRYPFINIPGFYFFKTYQSLSYCCAFQITENLFSGTYINVEQPTLSARMVQYNNKKNILLVSGCNHKVGKSPPVTNPYSTLTTFAHSIDPNAVLISKWSTEDSISLDKLPYIGEFSIFMPNIYVATGFKKWGMTFSNISANIIVDKILNKRNNYADIFSSSRLHPIQNRSEFKNMIKDTTNSLIIKKFSIPSSTLNTLINNEGKIIEIDGKKIGIYKDINGNLFMVKPICTHLGCNLVWNNINKTWDCPCHGSRFNYDGSLLYGPSLKNLETYN